MLKTIHRFFEPARLDPKEALKAALTSLHTAIYFDILPTLTIPLLFAYVAVNDTQAIQKLTYIIVGVLLLAFILRRYFMSGWYWYSYLAFRAKLEKVYRSKILLKDNAVFETRGIGKIQSIVDRGISTWSTSVNDAIWYLVSTVTTIVLGVYVLYKIGLVYLLVFLTLLLFSCLWYFFFKARQYRIQLEEYDTQTEYNASQIRSLMSRQEVIFSDKIELEGINLHDLSLVSQRILTRSDKPGTVAVNTIESIMIALPFVGVLVYFCLQDIDTLSVEQVALLTTFIVFSSRMSNMIWIFLSFVGRMMKDFPDIKKFWDFLDNTPDILGYHDGKVFSHKDGSIELKQVVFNYGEDGKKVIDNLSLNISGGSKVALVGRSGSGKTTIAKLITGYMRPTSGQVFVDDQDLSGIALKTYYPYVGYLTQEPMVFDGSIRENLLYGAREGEITDTELNSALSRAECQFVQQMKDGLDTQIGEKGIRLSGGERQRLAIAKLLLKNPEIVVLDEPTSALDSFSEEAVTRALDELFKDRTVIIIAHRLQTVKRADKILVLDKGEIVEQGTHRELVDKGGEYARMLEMQSGF